MEDISMEREEEKWLMCMHMSMYVMEVHIKMIPHKIMSTINLAFLKYLTLSGNFWELKPSFPLNTGSYL